MPEESKNLVQTQMPAAQGPQQGVAAVNSAVPAPQDVTASVNTQQQPQPQNPFVVNAPAIPTQEGPMGIRYDFNDGARVLLPKGKWHVQIEDDETDNIIFACDADEGWVLSTKKYYIPFRIRVWVRGEKEPKKVTQKAEKPQKAQKQKAAKAKPVQKTKRAAKNPAQTVKPTSKPVVQPTTKPATTKPAKDYSFMEEIERQWRQEK